MDKRAARENETRSSSTCACEVGPPFVPGHNDHRISLISMSPLSVSPATEEEEEEEEEEEREERVKGIDYYTRLVKE